MAPSLGEMPGLHRDDPGAPGVRHVRLDVTDAAAVSTAVAGHDAVVHLASIVDPDGMGRHAAYRVDVDGSRHVLDAWRAARA